MKKSFLLCTDSNSDSYNGMINTIKSLEYTNPDIPITIFHNSLSDQQKQRIIKYNLVYVDDLIDNRHNRPDLGFGNYYRFYFNTLTQFDKVIYLDNDMVILDSLEDIFEIDSVIVAAGRHRHISDDFSDFNFLRDQENLEDEIWSFNSGFMCFDINYWSNVDLVSEISSYIGKYGLKTLKNPVNCLMLLVSRDHGGFHSVSKHYNFQVNNRCQSVRENSKGLLSPVFDNKFVKVLHWSGCIKYWHVHDYQGFDRNTKLKMEAEGYEYSYIFRNYYQCVEQFNKGISD